MYIVCYYIYCYIIIVLALYLCNMADH